jgi:FSR family fosmidomycin resistance protein-like MFS transporter
MLNVEGGDSILLYNGLAFGLQPLAGLTLDRINTPRRGAAFALLLSALGMIVTWVDLRVGIICAGTGSALFHAGAGGVAIQTTPKRATGIGLFTAFGVIGLAVGSQLAFYFSTITISGFVIVLTVLAAVIWFYRADAPEVQAGSETTVSGMEIFVAAIVIAVALRSFIWVTGKAGIDEYTQPALWIALSAGLGKLLGGILADRFGWRQWMVTALATSIPLLALKGTGFFLLLLGVFFLQSVTPSPLPRLDK